MARKRAPGGGRKPKNFVAKPLTIRMFDEMREELEKAARKRASRNPGWNLSQEILFRLRCSLNRELEHQRNQPMRDLCWLISDMAKRELHTDLPEQQFWHRDPFTFRAFKVAVAKLLDRLEPAGEMRPPRTLANVFQPFGPLDDPEMLGEYAADKELIALESATGRSAEERHNAGLWFGMGVRLAGRDLSPPLTIEEFDDALGAYPRIRRTFGIEEPREKRGD
jgi:hypothetical protein